MKGLKKTLVNVSSAQPSERVSDGLRCLQQLSRSKSQDSTSSKNKEAKASATAAANASPPPPPPNSAKPLPQPTSAVASLNHLNNASNHSLPSTNGSSNRSVSTSASPPNSDRRYTAPDRVSPAPPIVVVSPDASAEQSERHSLILEGAGGPLTPPRANALSRLRPTGPKDTIPIVGKPPRKQRSSRFVVNEKVEIERLPPFLGEYVAKFIRSVSDRFT